MQFFLDAIEAKRLYVSNLPVWVQYWMSFMQLVFGLSILFVWNRSEARWILAVTLTSVLVALVWGGLYGFGRMWGLWHIVFYTPVLVYCFRRRARLEFKSVYGIWVLAACLTMIVSLVFDVFDVIQALAA